jgi:hypothetical protein
VPITVAELAAIAVEAAHQFEARLRAHPWPSAADWAWPRLLEEPEPTTGDIETWELHSELVLVCPKVCERARELLPERDPDSFLARLGEPFWPLDDKVERGSLAPSLPVAVVAYALWRLAETARCSIAPVGVVVVLAVLADVLH